MTKKKMHKIAVSTAALVAAFLLALTGTFAWQSFSQRALNRAVADMNPGGRLHDDFDGTNKDVYVENFTDPTSGVAIYARVRLDEYMEIGKDAGADPSASKVAKSVVPEAQMDNPSTYKTHVPGDTTFSQYWDWDMGGSTVYMPTFNKNKDSLAADINGTFEGKPDTGEHYDDYYKYTLNEKKTSSANYGDSNTQAEEHTAQTTLTGTVMTMAQWVTAGSKPGNYWVWDTDGWYYWANPIEPGTATGLLLDGIHLKNGTLSSRWYYAISVVGQFVTADDLGEKNGTGFYDTANGAVPSADAEKLLEAIGAKKPDELESIRSDISKIQPGSTDTVTIDGIDWYVLAKDEASSRALLLSKDILEQRAFDSSSNSWKSSDLREYLNGTWLAAHPMLQQNAKFTTLNTIKQHNDPTLVPTVDQVFLLSEADVAGASNGVTTTATELYTYNGAQLPAPGGRWKAKYDDGDGVNNWWWLRSPREANNYVAIVGSDGTVDALHYSHAVGSVRPALWVDMGGSSAAERVDSITVSTGASGYQPGDQLYFTAKGSKADGTDVADAAFTWTVSGATDTENTKIDKDGLLTVGPNETGDLTVTATVIGGTKTGSAMTKKKLSALAEKVKSITPGSTDTVTIGNDNWYVVAQDEAHNRALLLRTGCNGTRVFNDTSPTTWEGSSMRTYLNNDWLQYKSTLKEYAMETSLWTPKEAGSTELVETKDKIFLLSVQDVYGNLQDVSGSDEPTDPKLYTYNGEKLSALEVFDILWGDFGSSRVPENWWFRSTTSSITETYVYFQNSISAQREPSAGTCYGSGIGVRPAFWFDLSK